MGQVPNDHDLIISLHVKMDNLTRITTEGFTDHEARIRNTESSLQRYKGASAVLLFLIGLVEPTLLWIQGRHR